MQGLELGKKARQIPKVSVIKLSGKNLIGQEIGEMSTLLDSEGKNYSQGVLVFYCINSGQVLNTKQKSS